MRLYTRIGKRRDVAGRRSHFDAAIESRDVRDLKSAAAGPGDVDALRIDVRARQQVVDRAHAIPNFPARKICARQIREIPQHGMLGADQVVAALCGFRIPELAALALSHRVPADHDVSAMYQPLAKRLVADSFRSSNVRPEREQQDVLDPVLRHVDERRHIDSRKTFKNQLLDMKAVHRNLSGDARMQWRSLAGKPPSIASKFFSILR